MRVACIEASYTAMQPQDLGESLNQSQPSEEPRVSQGPICLRIPATLSHWLGEAHGMHSLEVNVAIDCRAWQLEVLVNYTL